ncbi:MAG TPA: DUF1800 domain-containing protein [Gemmatimonadaceae bacterium]|nr:DUF1800 domain-containing protein [Gemmatimonadaceae bacterium]
MRSSRLSFALVALVVACSAGVPASTQTRSSPVAEPVFAVSETRELLPDEQVQQVLNRLAFGARPGDAEKVRAMGVDRWIALQLAPARIDDAAAEELVGHYQTLNANTADLVETFRQVQQARRREQMQLRADGDTTASKRDARREALADDPQLRELARRAQRIVGDVQSAKLARAVVSERQLDEVMVDFWENHFSVYSGKGQTRLFLASYDRDVIRPYALGKFRDLLGAVAKSPAMLFFLDNWQSAADSMHPTLAAARAPRQRPFGLARRPAPQRRARGLNENYARELMELHTLGVDGGYSQKDVIEVARALTGWTMNPREGAFVFRPEVHDAGTKVVLGHTLPAGRGIEDGEDVLDIVARHPSTAHFITTKLVRHFVSDSAPPALVNRCAAVFTRTDGDIRETMRCIVTSPEFFSRAAYRAKVKTPFEVVASALRAMNAQPDTTPRSAQLVARLGQPIFGRQTPDGWPDRGDAWMNTGAILNRINFGLAVAAGRVPGASLATWPSAVSLRGMSRPEQVDGVIKAVLGGQASPETRAILLSGENPLIDKLGRADSNTMAMDDSISTDEMMTPPKARSANAVVGKNGRPRANAVSVLNRPVQLEGLSQVVGLALGSPEFQRR